MQFENPFVVEHYLKYWRNTGSQRMGFLYGRYEPHKELPLGIKAVVSAIYEPPQVGFHVYLCKLIWCTYIAKTYENKLFRSENKLEKIRHF